MAEGTFVEDVSGGRREPLIEQGARLLEALDRAGFPVVAAFWLLDPESRTWKYVLASPRVTTGGPLQAYRDLQKYVGSAGLALQDVAVVSPHEQLVELLRGALPRTPTSGVVGIRFTGNTIKNVFIDDAYIYRVA